MNGNSAEKKLRQIFRFPQIGGTFSEKGLIRRIFDADQNGLISKDEVSKFKETMIIVCLWIGRSVYSYTYSGAPGSDYQWWKLQVVSLVSHLFHLMPKNAFDPLDSPEKVWFNKWCWGYTQDSLSYPGDMCHIPQISMFLHIPDISMVPLPTNMQNCLSFRMSSSQRWTGTVTEWSQKKSS